MKKNTLFLLLSVMITLFSCQKNTRDLESNINSTVRRSVQSTPTALSDVTSTFTDLIDFPVNIIVKENSGGSTYLTSHNLSVPMTFEQKASDSSQKFYLRELSSGALEIYSYSSPGNIGSVVPMFINRREPELDTFLSVGARRDTYGWRLLKGAIHDNSYVFQYMKSGKVAGSLLNSIKTYMAPYSNTGRQEFEIRPVDDFEIVNIEYINDASATISQQPDFITQWFYSNNTSIQQSMSTSFSQKATKTSSFSQTSGGSISIGASVSLKVSVAFASVDGTINTNHTTTNSATYGTSESTEDAQTYNFPINVAPRTSVTATATVGRYLINLKYKATLRGINTGKLLTVNGIWEGISCTDVKVALVEKSLDTGETLRSATLSKVPKTTFKF